MLYFDRIDVSEGIDVNRTSVSKERDICHYILNYSFKFQTNVCNRCHDLLMMSINLSNIVILNIKGSDYRCIICLNSKNEAINLRQNTDCGKKVEHYKKVENYKLRKTIKIFESIYKSGEKDYKIW